MDYLTKAEVEECLRFEPEEAVFCPDCTTRLILQEEGGWYCPNEMCLNEDSGELGE